MIRRSVLLLIFLLPLAVAAQPGPLAVTEHEWTIHTGGKCYGVRQYYWRGDPKWGGGRYTTLYFGSPLFTVRTRAGYVIAPVLLMFGTIGILFMPRRATNNEN